MPYVRLETTETVPADRKTALCARLSKACAAAIGKPEAYMMAVVQDGLAILRGGAPGPAAFVEVWSIGGLTPAVNRELSAKLCTILAESLGIPGERVYLNMLDVAPGDWGHDGVTFGGG